jgi:galactose mutarotase-like enzyme
MAEVKTSVAESENVLIHAGDCVVTVLPRFGGKIASIRVGSHELLQAPLAPIQLRTRTMTFDQADASGWDECLPSVAACSVKTAAGQAEIPDHGDLWRVEWARPGAGNREHEKSADSLNLLGKCFSLPLEVERNIQLTEVERGWRLKVDYRVRNCGKYAVPWSWAAHPLFACEKGDRIQLPASIHSLKVEGSGRERLGKSGGSVAWPIAALPQGGTTDLSFVDRRDSGIGDKLFAGPLNATENWCALERVGTGLRIRFQFDTLPTPYLGLWICYGGWPERPGPKQVCVAMEPSTAPVDSLAVTGEWSRQLAPGESFSWPMQIEIQRIERKTDARS